MTREEALEMTANAEIECGILNTYGHPAPEALLSSLRATVHRLVRALPVYPAGQVQVSATHYEKARALMDIWPMASVGLRVPREDKDVYLQRILDTCVRVLDGALPPAPTQREAPGAEEKRRVWTHEEAVAEIVAWLRDMGGGYSNETNELAYDQGSIHAAILAVQAIRRAVPAQAETQREGEGQTETP